MKKHYFFFAVLFLLFNQSSKAVTYNWATYVAGNLAYTNGNMSCTVTGSGFDTRGPQDPNGGTSNGYKSPKYVSAATINTYQGGLTNDYGMAGLVIGHDWTNLTTSTTVTITFTTPVGGPVSFNIYDINTGSWGGNNPVWIDKITVSGTDCGGNTIYPAFTGCANSVSGANNNIITGNGNCTNQTNTVTFNAPSVKTITLTYASGSPLASGYGSDPDPQYIILSDISTGTWSLLNVTSNNATIGCSSATATLSATSSVGNAAYSWAGPNSGNPAGTTPSASSTVVNAAGTYTVTVSDPGSGCSASASVAVTQNSTPPGASIATPASLTCTATSVTLTASSPTSGVTYSWSGGGTSATKSVSAASSYTVTVTNPANSCTSTASVTVNQNTTAPNAGIQTPASLSCSVTSVTLTATSTTGGATFAWSGGGTGATKTVSATGTYTVTVTDPANGCTSSASTTVTGSTGLTISTSAVNATCGNNNGSATVSVTSGSANAYLWSSGDNTSTAANLTAGTYTVTATGSGGCSATASVTVTGSSAPVIATSATNAVCGNSNGSATVTLSSGTATAYAWSSGATTATASNLAGGAYTVTVTGTNGCSASASATVGSSGSISISVASVNTSCGHNDGSANVSVNTGTATGYLWSNGNTTVTAANLAAGIYTVTVSDASGCSATASVTIAASSVNPVTISANQSVFCSTDSAIICAPTGYSSYIWNTGAVSACITTKLAGNYYVTVTDQNNCTVASNHLPITVHPQPPVSISLNGDTLMAYNSLTYQWIMNGQPIAGATSGLYIATQPGSYQVLVSDANGCTALSLPVVIELTGLPTLTEENSVLVYPNPLSGGYWNLSLGKNMIGGWVQIFDDNGRLIYKEQINKSQERIAMQPATGIYLLTFTIAGKTYSQKLSVTH